MTYTWLLPSPGPIAPSPSTTAALLQATGRTSLGGMLDQLIDPTTRDYVDDVDGSWVETADSRTLVMIMIEMRYGEDFYAPEDGTRVKSMLESGDPVTPELAIAETVRALGILEGVGFISDVVVTSDFDQTGRFTIVCLWKDLASGSPVDLSYVPFDQAA